MRIVIKPLARRQNRTKTRAAGVLFILIISGAAFGASSAACNSDSSSPDAGTDAATSPDGYVPTTLPDGAPNPATDSGGPNPGVDGSTPTGSLLPILQQAYVKASNTAFSGTFGESVALSGDGTTLAVGSPGESSASTGINGDQTTGVAGAAGAVYVFVRAGATWTQQAYIKASNARAGGYFGTSVALSSDGNTLAVGASGDDSASMGINASQTTGGLSFAGAAYVFNRTGAMWAQSAFFKSDYNAAEAYYGSTVALSGDGATLAVGARDDQRSESGINPLTDAGGTDNVYEAGAAFVYALSGGAWSEQAFIKSERNESAAEFGWSLALTADGNTLAIGSPFEESNATGINGDAGDTSTINAGAVYTYTRAGVVWSQDAYIKASNTSKSADFGYSVAFSSDGSTLAVGSEGESSNATGIGGNQADTSASQAGAAYIFAHAAGTWSQQAYIKASNTAAGASFGSSIGISGDGNTLVVGAYGESGGSSGVNGNQGDQSILGSGAVYSFARAGTTWSQTAYIKASNPQQSAIFGGSVALSADANILAVGADQEKSDAKGINGNQADTSLGAAGATYVFQ